MRVTNVTISLVLLCLLGSLVAGQEASPPPALQPIAVSAERDITAFFEPDFPFDWHDINAIIQSKQFAGAAIEELTGKSSELIPVNTGAYGGPGTPGWRALPHTSYFAYVTTRQDLIRGEGSLPLRLHVTVSQLGDEGKAVAEKYADLIIKHLNKVLPDLSHRSFERRLAQLKSAADDAERSAEMAARKVVELSDRLRQESRGLSESVLQDLDSDLKKQHQALEVDLAGMKGRAVALQKEVAKASERLKKSSKDDEVVRNLERVLEIRVKSLQTVKQLHEAGVVAGASHLDLTKAEEQVVLAQVELAQAKQADAHSADERLAKLNDDLSQIAISIAENEAKLKFVKMRIEEYEEPLADVAETKALRELLDKQVAQLISLRQKADAARIRFGDLESSFRPARVEVFELKPSDDNPSNAKDVESKAKKTGQR